MVGVKFDHVSKVLGQVKAVDNLTLDIAPGELFFLLGPSGCGKTTALRLVAGFYTPDEGRIFFNQRDQSRVPPHKRNTGMVFQNYARRVPNQLSGGQQQRVALARALVIEPDVVLLDEPLSNLDAKLRLETRGQIKEIHGKVKRTMIYVTHDQTEALSMADRIAVMRRGRIVQVGTPRGLYTHPESAFVAEFIGGTNLLPGRLEEADDFFSVRTDAGVVRAENGAKGGMRGHPVFCSVRPESIRLQPFGGSLPELMNQLTAEVQSIMYRGDSEEYSLRLSDGAILRAVEHDQAIRKPQVGDRVTIQFDPRDVVVLPQEESSE